MVEVLADGVITACGLHQKRTDVLLKRRSVVGIIILIYYIKSRISENNSFPAPTIEAPEVETTPQAEEKEELPVVVMTNKTDNRYYCPRCHSRLVKRHGPYGDFYGCESYGKTGCRYTRKFL